MGGRGGREEGRSLQIAGKDAGFPLSSTSGSRRWSLRPSDDRPRVRRRSGHERKRGGRGRRERERERERERGREREREGERESVERITHVVDRVISLAARD